MTRFTSCADADSVAERASAHILRALEAAREARGAAHLALSGGTTPARTHELLARRPEDLEGVEVWFADERCVPPEDAESNYRLVRETLLDPARIPGDRVHRMEGE
ncbi:MAG: 6-phosphogluconolactonase, partial [Solirubrobacteraceae bacterium]